jgi:hypothetical protein
MGNHSARRAEEYLRTYDTQEEIDMENTIVCSEVIKEVDEEDVDWDEIEFEDGFARSDYYTSFIKCLQQRLKVSETAQKSAAHQRFCIFRILMMCCRHVELIGYHKTFRDAIRMRLKEFDRDELFNYETMCYFYSVLDPQQLRARG